MTLPTASELSFMRSAVEDYALPDTCNILSLTQVSDGQGGVTDTWGTATANVKCRLDVIPNTNDAREQLGGGAIQDYAKWRLTIPYDETITTAHRVEKGDNTYNVVAVDVDQSWLVSKRCWVELV